MKFKNRRREAVDTVGGNKEFASDCGASVLLFNHLPKYVHNASSRLGQ